MRKIIRGVEHKLCTGPLHKDGEFIKLSDFYVRGNGNVRPQCKFCEVSYKNSEPWVPMEQMQFALKECIFRIGKAETARRLGIPQKTMSAWITKQPYRTKYMKRRNARALILLLAELRAGNEARHRASIHHGAAQRGRAEKIPKNRSDFNGANDLVIEKRKSEAERKRKARANAGLTQAV